MHDKKLPLALRLDRKPTSLQTMHVRTTKGQEARYKMLNLPYYLIWKLDEL